MANFESARNAMVDEQIAARGLTSPALLAAMRAIPRELFVAPDLEPLAYADCALPIGHGQTISQPYIVARMIEAAQIAPGARVLEVGAGSGYAAAIVSRIAGEVYAIERQVELADEARARLALLGCDNVRLYAGDGSGGWAPAAPYDAILVAAAGPRAPPSLGRQLAVGGRLVMPVGAAGQRQRLIKVTRVSPTKFTEHFLDFVGFVPLIGAEGWAADEAS